MSAKSLLAAGLARTHRLLPRAAGHVHTSMFVNTRESGNYPEDLCPLGARRLALTGIPRVSAAYVWGDDVPGVLALHGWGADSTAMSAVVAAAVSTGESAVCFDAPGHGISPGSQATITEYAHATQAVLQYFPSIHTVVAHSLASLAAVAAVAENPGVRTLLLLAPACSLSAVLDRWAAQQNLPQGVVAGIYRDLERRDGIPVSYWDITALGLPPSVAVHIVHDPADDVVPLHDSTLIAGALAADLRETTAGIGHHGLVGSDDMRRALTTCLIAR